MFEWFLHTLFLLKLIRGFSISNIHCSCYRVWNHLQRSKFLLVYKLKKIYFLFVFFLQNEAIYMSVSSINYTPITKYVFYKSNQDSFFFFIWSLSSTEDKKHLQRCKSNTLTSPKRRLTQLEISGNQSTVSSWRRVGVMDSECHRGTEEKSVQTRSKEPRFCSQRAHSCSTRDQSFKLSSDSSSINLFFKNEKNKKVEKSHKHFYNSWNEFVWFVKSLGGFRALSTGWQFITQRVHCARNSLKKKRKKKYDRR